MKARRRGIINQGSKLSESGAIEQGERANAGRRGRSRARSPPAGDEAPVPQAAAGCAIDLARRWRVTCQVSLGKALASDLSGLSRMSNPKPSRKCSNLQTSLLPNPWPCSATGLEGLRGLPKAAGPPRASQDFPRLLAAKPLLGSLNASEISGLPAKASSRGPRGFEHGGICTFRVLVSHSLPSTKATSKSEEARGLEPNSNPNLAPVWSGQVQKQIGRIRVQET